jgi:hypothetical protein
LKPELLEKLLHECECTFLDFKQAQYPFVGATITDEAKSELLKDILAIANADKPHDGYILIGVEEMRGQRAKVVGTNIHLNDNDVQQFVNSKTQRPLTFAYEVVPCDGVSVGVIRVPAQQRPFFLKNDFGKLRRNVVYYRLGSSTNEASPDELFRWGQQLSSTDAPELAVQFAHIKRPTIVGGSAVTRPAGITLHVQTRNSAVVSDAEIARLAPPAPRLAFSDDHEYFKEFAKYVRFGFLFAPIGLMVTNSGSVAANGVVVRLLVSPTKNVVLIPAQKFPPRPLHKSKLRGNKSWVGEPMASYVSLPEGDLAVREEADELTIEWNVAKVLPKLPVFSEGVFFLGAKESGPVEFKCIVYAENVRQPTSTVLSITVDKIAKDLSAEEIGNLSEAFAFVDLANGTGNLNFVMRGAR